MTKKTPPAPAKAGSKKKIAVKKVIAKKKVAKTTASRPRKPAFRSAPVEAAPGRPVGDVFTTQRATDAQAPVTVQPGHVRLYIKGNDNGEVLVTGLKLLEFVKAQANAAGIRTFSVYLDGQKATMDMSDMPMESFAKVEIVPKDARGLTRS